MDNSEIDYTLAETAIKKQNYTEFVVIWQYRWGYFLTVPSEHLIYNYCSSSHENNLVTIGWD